MNNSEIINALASMVTNYVDKGGLLYFKQKIDALLLKKVDKIDGKGLSTNDYTTDEKNKLGKVNENAQVNVIEEITVDSQKITPLNKSVNIDLSGKVDKQEGKDLSTNDYTTAEKNKLKKVNENAEVNKINEIKVNNVALSPVGKSVNIDLSEYAKTSAIPTKVSDLNNDSKFITLDAIPKNLSEFTNDSKFQTDQEVTAAISAAVGGIAGLEFKKVPVLPETGKGNIIYLVPMEKSATPNLYNEYIWVDNNFELIGSTNIDLSNYYNSSNFTPLSNEEIDTIFK